MSHIREKKYFAEDFNLHVLYVHMLRGLEGGIMNLTLLLLYRLQWVKFRFHQHYPVNMHTVQI